MTVFWILAAGLTVLALCLLLPALLHTRPDAAVGTDATQANLAILRGQLAQLDAEHAAGSLDAEQHRSARAEIARRVLDEEAVAAPPRRAGAARTTALSVGLAVPLFALVGYGFLGNMDALSARPAAIANGSPEAEVKPEQVTAMVESLAKRMQQRPDDPMGWTLLARAYGALQRFPEASQAYARAIALSPKDAQLLADHADVLAMLQNRSVSGEPARLVAQALLIDPKNQKALALAGSAAFERKDFALAITHWTQARQLAPADSEFAAGLDSSIAEARGLAAGAGGVTATPASTAAASATVTTTAASASATATATVTSTSSAGVTGRVTLAPALEARVAPTDTVFIFARAADGPRMPLAIMKRRVSDLPISFKLDDSQAMSPEMKLSKFASVVVGARISKSGQATPTAGDLTGQSKPLAAGGPAIELVIDSVQP